MSGTVADAVAASRFVRVPLAHLADPQKSGPLMVYRDHWWASDDEGNAFFFDGKSYSPQCNVNRLIVERHLASGLATHAVLLPWAYVQFSISDYT